jgi:hypothetical protein
MDKKHTPMTMLPKPSIFFLTLSLAATLAGCFQADFQRECRANRDCPEGQLCRFSNCIVPAEGELCDPGQIRCEDTCIDPATDLLFCGGCGGCDDLNGADAVSCVNGICQFQCTAGFRDIDGDLQNIGSNGCECDTNIPEVCDGADNDCDRAIDEDDTDLDLSSCPTLTNAAPQGCTGTECRFVCDDAFVDLNQDLTDPASDGCECDTRLFPCE